MAFPNGDIVPPTGHARRGTDVGPSPLAGSPHRLDTIAMTTSATHTTTTP